MDYPHITFSTEFDNENAAILFEKEIKSDLDNLLGRGTHNKIVDVQRNPYYNYVTVYVYTKAFLNKWPEEFMVMIINMLYRKVIKR